MSEGPAWIGGLTRQQAVGAVFTNGSRVKKQGDGIAKGSDGTVLGSILDPEKGIYYFVEWDGYPGIAVAQHAGSKTRPKVLKNDDESHGNEQTGQ